MKFDRTNFQPYISVELPSAPYANVDFETSSNETAEAFRERLIAGWIKTLQAKAGGTAASDESIRNNDPFCRWVGQTPEPILRKWERDSLKLFRLNPSQEAIQTAGETAFSLATEAIFLLSARCTRRVSSNELLASNVYQQLDKHSQLAARHIVENYQRQREDGTWFLTNAENNEHESK